MLYACSASAQSGLGGGFPGWGAFGSATGLSVEAGHPDKTRGYGNAYLSLDIPRSRYGYDGYAVPSGYSIRFGNPGFRASSPRTGRSAATGLLNGASGPDAGAKRALGAGASIGGQK